MNTYSLAAFAAVVSERRSQPLIVITINPMAGTSNTHSRLGHLGNGALGTLRYEGTAVLAPATLEEGQKVIDFLKADLPDSSSLDMHAILFHNGKLIDQVADVGVNVDLTLTPV